MFCIDLQPPQNGDMMYPPQSVNGGYGGGTFCINNLSSDLTNNLNIQNSPPHGLGAGEAADYLTASAAHQQEKINDLSKLREKLHFALDLYSSDPSKALI